MWKFNIPRNPESTSADTGHNPESTSADTGTGSRVNLQTAQSQPALTENPRRTPEVYKPLKQNTGCSHCLKTPMQANTYLGNSRQHKKTTSFKKTNVSKKTKPRRAETPLSPVDERKRRTYTKTPGRLESRSTLLTARPVGGRGSSDRPPAPKP